VEFVSKRPTEGRGCSAFGGTRPPRGRGRSRVAAARLPFFKGECRGTNVAARRALRQGMSRADPACEWRHGDDLAFRDRVKAARAAA